MRQRTDEKGRVKPSLMVRKTELAEDKRISVCTDCKWGIFKQHRYKWTSRGLVHVNCREGRLNEVKLTS